LAHWVGAQVLAKLAKNGKKFPPFLVTPENPKSKTTRIFFPISSRILAESVERLNSSLAQSAGELWSEM